jgi:hypothetical protein
MKKSLIITLALVFVLGIAGTAFAANPFVDVPAKHWSYDAVSKLAAAGIIDGYGDGTFKGDKAITRYEMAQIIAKAMTKEDSASAENKALIRKLATEYKAELDNLGVRVGALESKVDNVKWGGEVRERYDSQRQEGKGEYTGSHSYVDMWAHAQVNPDWQGVAEYESSKSLTTGKDGGEGNTTRVYAQGNAFGGTLRMGRFNPLTAYGLIIDDNVTGADFTFGKVLKARIGAGRLNRGSSTGNQILGAPDFNRNFASTEFNKAAYADSPAYRYIDLSYPTSKATNVKAAYHRLSDIATSGVTAYDPATGLTTGGKFSDNVNYLELGFDTKLSPDFTWMGTYSKSNINIAGQDNKGYFTQLNYKTLDLKQQGSFSPFFNYRKVPVNSQIDATWDYARDVKGWSVGFDYVPTANAKFETFYLKGNTITDGRDANIYRAQVEFFF